MTFFKRMSKVINDDCGSNPPTMLKRISETLHEIGNRVHEDRHGRAAPAPACSAALHRVEMKTLTTEHVAQLAQLARSSAEDLDHESPLSQWATALHQVFERERRTREAERARAGGLVVPKRSQLLGLL